MTSIKASIFGHALRGADLRVSLCYKVLSALTCKATSARVSLSPDAGEEHFCRKHSGRQQNTGS